MTWDHPNTGMDNTVASFLPRGKGRLKHRTQAQPSESVTGTSKPARDAMQVQKSGFMFMLAMYS